MLDAAQLEREPWPDLLQPCLLFVLVDVSASWKESHDVRASHARRRRRKMHEPVMPEEDEVALIVEGDDSSALEVWLQREDGRKHTTHSVTQP